MVQLGPGTAGSEMVLLVSLSGVQESVTVQTRECRSCQGAQLGHTPGGLEGTHRSGCITAGWERHFLDLLREIQLQNATQNSDVAKVELVGSCSYPRGYRVSSAFPFCILWGCPDSDVIRLLHVLCSAAEFQPRDPESSHKLLLLKTANGH